MTPPRINESLIDWMLRWADQNKIICAIRTGKDDAEKRQSTGCRVGTLAAFSISAPLMVQPPVHSR